MRLLEGVSGFSIKSVNISSSIVLKVLQMVHQLLSVMCSLSPSMEVVGRFLTHCCFLGHRTQVNSNISSAFYLSSSYLTILFVEAV